MKRVRAIRALRLNYKWRGVWAYLRGYNRIHRCRGITIAPARPRAHHHRATRHRGRSVPVTPDEGGAVEAESTVGPIQRVWTVKLYRDDSTTPIVYEDVKHLFWTADNSVLVIAQFTEGLGQEAHHYIHWPRERVCWYRLARA